MSGNLYGVERVTYGKKAFLRTRYDKNLMRQNFIENFLRGKAGI
jgi:hypothetical protein